MDSKVSPKFQSHAFRPLLWKTLNSLLQDAKKARTWGRGSGDQLCGGQQQTKRHNTNTVPYQSHLVL